MKHNIKIRWIAVISLLLIVSFHGYSQNNIRNLRYQDQIWKIWTVEANAGLLSFYGDLSSYDANYINKLEFESLPAFSLNLSKHFNRLFGISGQLLMGRLKGTNDNTSFEANLIEYNLNAKLNLFNLFYPNNKGKFGITAQAGVGQFLFSSEKTVFFEGNDKITKHEARVPEFEYFIGAGSFFKTSDRFGISLDVSLHQCQNDMIDIVTKSNDYDYYTYLSIGVTYYLERIKKGPVKNKARVAHNNSKLKHLNF